MTQGTKSPSDQQEWEAALECKLSYSTPEEVLDVYRRILSWIVSYCPNCGARNDLCGGNRKCECYEEPKWEMTARTRVEVYPGVYLRKDFVEGFDGTGY
jgi:hypothetical protein